MEQPIEPKKTNQWVEHVREFSKKHGLTYACALSTPECKASYTNPNVKYVSDKQKLKDLTRKIKNVELTAEVRKSKIVNEKSKARDTELERVKTELERMK
jgi:hypothetical protein